MLTHSCSEPLLHAHIYILGRAVLTGYGVGGLTSGGKRRNGFGARFDAMVMLTALALEAW